MAKTGDIASLVFKRATQVKPGGFSLDAQTLKTLLALDGKMPLGDVAQTLGLDMAALRPIMKRLAENQLILRVEKQQTTVPESFLSLLTAELWKATGPIAEALLEDVLEDLDISATHISTEQAPELVKELSKEIPDNQRRIAFIKMMLSALQS